MYIHLKRPNIYSKIMYMGGGARASLRASMEKVSPEVRDGGAMDCGVVQDITVSDCSLEEGISLYIYIVGGSLLIESLSTSGAVTGTEVFVTVNVYQVVLYFE